MRLQLDESDLEVLIKLGKAKIHLAAYWKRPDGELFALASGHIEVELVEGIVDELMKKLNKI